MKNNVSQSVYAPAAQQEIEISGFCTDEFNGLKQRFIDNFVDCGELGAQLCVYHRGEIVTQLYGGLKSKPRNDQELAQAWQPDTLTTVYSCTKAATALCAHILIANGELELHAPVAEYWPEFAVNGKQDTTVAMMLSHASAVPALREPVAEGGYYNWDYMVDRVAQEQAFWTPGERHGYHMMTFGWTVGELVRRVSGRSLGEFFQENVCNPFGFEFYIGLPESLDSRVAPVLPARPNKAQPVTPFTRTLVADKNSIPHLAFFNNGKHRVNSRAARAAELGGGGGITNGTGLAAMYQAMISVEQGLFKPDYLHYLRSTVVAGGMDLTLLMPSRFSLGFMKSMDNRHRASGGQESIVLGEQAFGHAGAGGSLGFADTEHALSFGYVMNQMGPGLALNQRGQGLVDACYQSLPKP